MASAESGRASWNSLALWVLATVAMLFFLRQAAQLLIPIVLAVLLSYALEPVVAWLQRHHVPRTAGTSLVLVTLLTLLGWGAYSLKDNVRNAIDALPRVVEKARGLASSAGMTGVAGQGQQGEGSGSGTAGQTGSGSAVSGGGGSGGGGAVPGLLQRGVSSAFALAGHFVVIVFLVFFLLLSGHHVRDRLVEISGPDEKGRRTAAQILDEINAQIQRFLLVRLVTAVVVGALTWIVLALMNVQNAALWGVLAGLFNSIPYFGPVIVSGGLLVVGLVQGGGLTQALQMSGAALVITSLEGWLLTPPLMGKAERMSVLAVFLGLLLWTWLWGAWGTLLAVPMLVVMKSIADHVGPLKPLGRLMAP